MLQSVPQCRGDSRRYGEVAIRSGSPSFAALAFRAGLELGVTVTIQQMEWDDEVLCLTLLRSVSRRMMGSWQRPPGSSQTIDTVFHTVRIEDDVMVIAPRRRIDNTRKSLWLHEILEIARAHNCSTIKCITSDRLTPTHHHEALLEHGFTQRSEGVVLGAAVEALDIRTPELLVDTAVTGRSLAAASRLNSALWGWPALDTALVTELLGGLAEIPERQRDKHDVVVWIDGQPAGIGNLAVDGDVATLGEGATLPECRRRGAYTALVDARLGIARDVGCRTVVAHTENPWAEEVLRSRGLEVVDRTKLYTLSEPLRETTDG